MNRCKERKSELLKKGERNFIEKLEQCTCSNKESKCTGFEYQAGIYKLSLKANDFEYVYIGQSLKLYQRLRKHIAEIEESKSYFDKYNEIESDVINEARLKFYTQKKKKKKYAAIFDLLHFNKLNIEEAVEYEILELVEKNTPEKILMNKELEYIKKYFNKESTRLINAIQDDHQKRRWDGHFFEQRLKQVKEEMSYATSLSEKALSKFHIGLIIKDASECGIEQSFIGNLFKKEQ